METILITASVFVLACILLCFVVFQKLQDFHIFLEKLYRPKPAREAIQVVTTADAQGVELILITSPGLISDESVQRITKYAEDGLTGTALEGAKVFVMGDGLQAHFIKTKGGSRPFDRKPSAA
jgi:hypothetical protein